MSSLAFTAQYWPTQLGGALCAVALMGACRTNSASTSPAPTVTMGGQLATGGGGNGGGGLASAGGTMSAATGGAGSGSAGVAGAAGQAVALPSLAVGPFSACVIDADGLVKCAGICGPFGHGGSRDQAPSGAHARSVAVGREFVCALLVEPQAGNAVQCWGADPAATPPMLGDAVALVAGDRHACAQSSSGAVTCWGDDAHIPPAGIVAKSLAASGAMTCAITGDDSLRCWGPHAVEPPTDLRARELALGSQLADSQQGPRFGCAITTTNDVLCFGDDVGHVQMPPSGLKAKHIAVGRSNACAISQDDGVVCWGTPPRNGVAAPTDLKASALSLAFRGAGAVMPDGKLAFWGDFNDARSSL